MIQAFLLFIGYFTASELSPQISKLDKEGTNQTRHNTPDKKDQDKGTIKDKKGGADLSKRNKKIVAETYFQDPPWGREIFFRAACSFPELIAGPLNKVTKLSSILEEYSRLVWASL